MASAVGLIFTGIFCQILPVIFSQQQPIAQVEQGQIRGRTVPFENDYLNLQKNIDVFLGIPYAEPPIGDYRFAPPLPKTPWSEDDVYDATYNRSVCVQTDAEADLYTQSEDCLHLNVYAPNPKVRGRKTKLEQISMVPRGSNTIYSVKINYWCPKR